MKDGEPWFVAADVCKVLGITNTTLALKTVRADDRKPLNGVKGLRGGPQTANGINERGLYKLVFKSRKPEAERFLDWVTGTVLPAIRKDGIYIQGEERVATGEMDEEALIARARNTSSSLPNAANLLFNALLASLPGG